MTPGFMCLSVGSLYNTYTFEAGMMSRVCEDSVREAAAASPDNYGIQMTGAQHNSIGESVMSEADHAIAYPLRGSDFCG